MATNDAGIEVPAATDVFDPDGDMRDMGTSLTPRVVIPVANETARDALTPSAGWLINRLDTGVLERYDGTNWQPGASFGDTGWVSIAFKSGYEQFNSTTAACKIRREGDDVRMVGLVKPSSGNFAAGATVAIADIPAQFLPPNVGELWLAPTSNPSAFARASLKEASAADPGELTVRPTDSALASYIGLFYSWKVG